MASKGILAATLQKRRPEIQAQWLNELEQGAALAKGRVSSEELRRQASEFMDILLASAQSQDTKDLNAPGWLPVRSFLDELSRRRVLAGFSSDETATFIFSLKRPVFDALRAECGADAGALSAEIWAATELGDKFGLHTVKAFQTSREERS